jgi:DNA-directed RNA polymerase specialized sigma24 family protein
MFAESRHARGYCRKIAAQVMPLDPDNGMAEGVAEILRLERRGEMDPAHLLRAAKLRIWMAARAEARDRRRCLEYARMHEEARTQPPLDSRLDLRAMLPQLTTKQLEAVWRHSWRGQSWAEAGAEMGVSPKTAASHYSHALTALRGMMA